MPDEPKQLRDWRDEKAIAVLLTLIAALPLVVDFVPHSNDAVAMGCLAVISFVAFRAWRRVARHTGSPIARSVILGAWIAGALCALYAIAAVLELLAPHL